MYEFIYYQVRDVMTKNPITVRKLVSLAYVEAIFEEHDFNGLPVVDDSHRLLGMITKLDLLKAFSFTERSKIPHYNEIMGQKVLNVMKGEPLVVYPDSPLTRVLHLMTKTGHKSFPVIENDYVIGIVAREDILRALRLAAQGNLPERLTRQDTEVLSEASNF